MFSIIIPVHNQKEYLARCVASVVKNTPTPYELVLVDDGSSTPTRDFCRGLRDEGIVTCLLRNEEPRGFTYSVNRGILAVRADFYTLLNSDTEIGTMGWTEKIASAVSERNDRDDDRALAGVLGVVSNNATMQSMFCDGKIPEGWSPSDVAEALELISGSETLRCPLVNGFCYTIPSYVVERLPALLDGEKFPHYGSEDHFSMQVLEQGFQNVVVPDVFVYHASNKSYGSEREKLCSVTVPQFVNEWGKERIDALVKESWAALAPLRVKVKKFVSLYDKKKLTN